MLTVRIQKAVQAVALVCCLGATPAAFAIPFSVEITSSPYAAGFGTWSLSGPTSAADTWIVGFDDSYWGGADVTAGNYVWSLFGGGIGIGSISWTLFLDGQAIYAGSDRGLLAFYVGDSTSVGVGGSVTSVPEPGTLLLLGTALAVLTVSRRRRQAL